VLVAAEQAQLALALNLATWVTLPLVQIYGAASARNLHPTLRRVFLAANVALVAITLAALKTLFWPEESDAHLLLFRSFNDVRLNGLWVSAVFFTVVILERRHQARVRQASFDALELEAQASRQAEAQLSERSSLIDMLTHELKNPLSTIRLAAESLGSRLAADEDSRRRVGAIQRCVTRMDTLIEHVAHANKIELLQPAPQGDPVAAQTIILAVIRQLGLDGRVASHVPPAATFAAEPQLIRVVFENLLKNASTYGLADKPIELSVSSQPDGTTRVVVSNGVAPGGMPDAEQIFTRYYRHTQSQVHPGMGIGLSLVRSTVVKIGGTIEYHPGNHRVTFIVRIPS
jgi:signal transduction histidine kinase